MAYYRKVIASTAMGPSEAKKFELALEEAILNIILYAYEGKDGLVEIAYDIDKESGVIQFQLKDSGTPFNPALLPEITPPKSCESQKEGGLGILFIHKMVDKMEYSYCDNQNILTLTKKIRG
jgi:serine/threonine-protein kinase RsbW